MIKTLWVLILFLYLAGCQSWPPQSTGGYAQHYLLLYPQATCARLTPHIKLSQALRQLCKSHARKCYPSRFRLLELLDRQIAQEIAAGLCTSARYDLMLFKKNLAVMQRLNSIRGCPGIRSDKAWMMLQARIV
jgi:hypothetical protein